MALARQRVIRGCFVVKFELGMGMTSPSISQSILNRLLGLGGTNWQYLMGAFMVFGGRHARKAELAWASASCLGTRPEESRQSILRILLMLVMLLASEFGRALEAELFVSDVSSRVGNVAADAERARGQRHCRNRQRQRSLRPLPSHGD